MSESLTALTKALLPDEQAIASFLQNLSELFPGEMQHYALNLHFGALQPEDRRAVDLLDRSMIEAVETRFQRRFDVFDMRAVLSIWTKWHLTAILPSLIAATIYLDRQLPVKLDDVHFIISPDQRSEAIRLKDLGVEAPFTCPFSAFEALVFDHLTPLIDIFAAKTRLTRRILWSNAGNTFEAVLGRLARDLGASERLDAARKLTSEPFWPDGRTNPLYDAVRYIGVEKERCRRICCIQYLLPDRRFCKACPLPPERRALFSVTEPKL